jgi:hypothetical protein
MTHDCIWWDILLEKLVLELLFALILKNYLGLILHVNGWVLTSEQDWILAFYLIDFFLPVLIWQRENALILFPCNDVFYFYFVGIILCTDLAVLLWYRAQRVCCFMELSWSMEGEQSLLVSLETYFLPLHCLWECKAFWNISCSSFFISYNNEERLNLEEES